MHEAMFLMQILQLLDPNNAGNATLYSTVFQGLLLVEGYFSSLDLLEGIAPVTNAIVLLLIAIHFLKYPRNDRDQYSFNADAITKRKEVRAREPRGTSHVTASRRSPG